MTEWVILQTPAALILYLLALAGTLVSMFLKKSKGILAFISTVIFLIASAILVILGGSLWECATYLILFLLIRMGGKS